MLRVVLAAPIELIPLQVKSEPFRSDLKYPFPLGDDFPANPVARDYGDAISWHKRSFHRLAQGCAPQVTGAFERDLVPSAEPRHRRHAKFAVSCHEHYFPCSYCALVAIRIN